MLREMKRLFLAQALVFCLSPLALGSQNLLINPSFNKPTPGVPKGFGSTTNDDTGVRGAKVASAALRFLKPNTWGVVDWRTAAMLEFLNQTNGDVDQAMVLAKNWRADNLRETYKGINEDWACEINQKYRDLRATASFPRTVNVEMAIFGLSMMAWPVR